MTTQKRDRYRIIRKHIPGDFSSLPRIRWHVMLGAELVKTFDLKSNAVAWITKQEFPHER